MQWSFDVSPHQGLDHSIDPPDFFIPGTFYHLGHLCPEDFLIRLFVVEIKEVLRSISDHNSTAKYVMLAAEPRFDASFPIRFRSSCLTRQGMLYSLHKFLKRDPNSFTDRTNLQDVEAPLSCLILTDK